MDLIDIDEALKDDSFILLKEDAQNDVVGNILQQWKQNSTSEGAKFDTRTFTRPKRKLLHDSDSNYEASSFRNDGFTNSQNSSINLQIGGLVTSMQRSFLCDVSPPSSIFQSMDMTAEQNMNNSLITSGDFTNVSYFKTNVDESLISSVQFNGYNLDDMIEDERLLDNLTLSGDSTFIKDSNIAQIDEINLPSSITNSHNSTMCNSTESTGCDVGGSGEIKTSESGSSYVMNTFFKIDQTIVQSQDVSEDVQLNSATEIEDTASNTTFGIKNETENEIISKIQSETGNISLNRTFEKSDSKKLVENMKDENLLVLESVHDQTFNLNNEDKDFKMNETFDALVKESENNSFDLLGTPKVQKQLRDLISTPQWTPPPRIYEAENISPISAVCENTQNGTPVRRLSSKNQEMHLRTRNLENDLREDLEQLDEDHDENGLDEFLHDSRLSALSAESQKMRQSLDYIKKRHSLINYEKQKHNSSYTKDGKNDQQYDINKSLSESFEKISTSSLSMSGSGERLLNRRSRLYDNINMDLIESKSSKSAKSLSSSSSGNEENTNLNNALNDYCSNKTTVQMAATEGNAPSTETSSQQPISCENQEKAAKCRDRDRFKTIRIFRKTQDSALNVPCVDDEDISLQSNNVGNEHMLESELEKQQIFPQSVPPIRLDEARFSRKDSNSPKLNLTGNSMLKFAKGGSLSAINKIKNIETSRNNAIRATGEKVDPSSKSRLSNGNDHSRQRSLSRPKYSSGLARPSEIRYRESALPKASSAGSLDMDSNSILSKKQGYFGFSSKLAFSKPVSQPSLLQGRNLSNENSKSDSTVFKIPPPVSNLRVTNSNRTGLVRPSSGFYGHNGPRNCSDPESGRNSPSDSVSSASSKGSVQDLLNKAHVERINNKIQHIQDTNKTKTNEMFNKKFEIVSQKQLATAQPTVKTGIPKPSGLRPPSNLRKSGLPRPSSCYLK